MISPKSGGKKTLLPLGRSVFLRLKRWSAFAKMQCPLFYQTRCVFFKGCSSSLLLFLGGLLFFPRAAKEKKQKKTAFFYGFYFNCTIGAFFQREKPLKRYAMFSNSIKAMSSSLHFILNPLKC